MARTLVADLDNNTRVPFLRGILTRSLEHAGLSFEAAYELASVLRDELSDEKEITTEALQTRVAELIHRQHGEASAKRYLSRAVAEESLMVTGTHGQPSPFSRARHQRFLQSCGMTAHEARPVTARIYEHLVARPTTHVTSNWLGNLTYRYLKRDIGQTVARRYLLWTQFIRSGRPLILLIGGTVGCGKSTIATEVAHHLEIVRIQSTDMLREVMRIMLPDRLLPVLHTSSFLAWQARPGASGDEPANGGHVIEGYRSQADLLAVPCEAVISRAIRERVSLILEGVHIEPGMARGIPADTDAIVVEALLSVLQPKLLKKRLLGRGKIEPERRADRYLKNFDAIWQIQSHLLSEADRSDVAIIPNDDKGSAVGDVMIAIIDALSKEFHASAREVFGESELRPRSRR